MGIKSTAKGRCMVNVAWEEQANGPEGAYCRVDTSDRKKHLRPSYMASSPHPNRVFHNETRIPQDWLDIRSHKPFNRPCMR